MKKIKSLNCNKIFLLKHPSSHEANEFHWPRLILQARDAKYCIAITIDSDELTIKGKA